MFKGIIEDFGIIDRIEPRGEGRSLRIGCGIDLSGTVIGDSIAVNGACLTVVSLDRNFFKVDVAPETVERTAFRHLVRGAGVNIERALRLSDRIDGHLVSGHIDGTGIISSVRRKSNSVIVTIDVSEKLAADMIEKGSVAVDGISLTVNRCYDENFEISIIPHTASVTTIGTRNIGDEVNIETDMIGKYVKKILMKDAERALTGRKKDISISFLAEKGFI